MQLLQQLQTHIVAIRALPQKDFLEPNETERLLSDYAQVLDSLSVPSWPLTGLRQLLQSAYQDDLSGPVVGEAIQTVLSKHGLYPQAGEVAPFAKALFDQSESKGAHVMHRSVDSKERPLPSSVQLSWRSTLPPYFVNRRYIADGSGAKIIHARDERSRDSVVIKLFEDGMLGYPLSCAYAFNELRFQADPLTAGIVEALDAGRDSQRTPYVCFEYIGGGNMGHDNLLSQVDENHDRPIFLMPLLRQLIGCVATLHSGGIIHRDIKPTNILLNSSWTQIKLNDFSLALRQDEVKPLGKRQPIGDPSYMAPELRQKDYCDEFSRDVFALGKTLKDIVSSGLKSAAGSNGPIIEIEGDDLQRVERVIARATAVDRERRYVDAEQMLADLDHGA